MIKKALGVIFNRITITFFLLFVQVAWLVAIYLFLTDKVMWIHMALTVLSVAMFFAVVMSNQNPMYKISWLALIGIGPIFGGLLYFFIGNKKPTRKMRDKLKKADRYLMPYKVEAIERSDLAQNPDNCIEAYAARTCRFSTYKNTDVKYYKVGEDLFEVMLEDLKKAEKFIFFEYFIIGESYMWDEIKKVFKEKAAAGVDIRVIVDDFGSLKVLPKKFKEELNEMGIKVFIFNPLIPILSMAVNNRDHRKLMVVDGVVGYTGGINIDDEYINKKMRFGHWKDTGIRLEGEGVQGLTLIFLEIWYAFNEVDKDISQFLYENNKKREIEAKGVVLPFSDSPLDNETLSENIYMDIIWNAKDYVYIFTPYLIIDNEMQVALTMAAKRGVDVRLVVPGIPDKKIVYELTKSYFKVLMEAGVKIYTYTPGFIHAKSYLSDDKVGVVGTINMDFRSLYLHFECGVLLNDCEMLEDLKKDYLEVFEVSKEAEIADCRLTIWGSAYYAILKLLSPLM